MTQIDTIELERISTVGWVLFGMSLFVAEAFHDAVWFLIPTAILIIVEGRGLIRKKLGDTLSEHLWAFYGKRPARTSLLVGFAAYLVIRGYWLLGGATVMLGVFDLALVALCLGALVWLVWHLLSLGKAG